jgi:hypothetical protein
VDNDAEAVSNAKENAAINDVLITCVHGTAYTCSHRHTVSC